MRRILVFSLVLVSYLSVSAQNQGPTCAQTLRLARATYEQGRLQEIGIQLKKCLRSPEEGGFSKEEKQLRVEAHKILCLSYIYLEEAEKADSAMMNILKTDPYFQINAAVDPAEFVALYKTFRTHPIYRLGAKLGINASQPNVSEGIVGVDAASGSEYKFLIGFQVGASADLPLYFISKKLTLHADIMFQQKRFDLTLNVNRGEGKDGEMLTNKFTGVESQSWLSIPLTFEYEILNNNKFHPYVALGSGVDLLLSSSITAERPREGQASIEEKSFEPNREKINLNAIAAAGIKMPLSGGFLVFEVRYSHGLVNITTPETAFSNTQFALDYGYADSIYKVNSLAITGSYILNFFNPKKLKRK
jgi:hypothetical protein